MKTRMIVEIGYQRYLIPNGIHVADVVQTFTGILPVKREYVEGTELFSPDDADPPSIEIKMVPEDRVRSLTPEEKENKEIKDLKSSVSYKETVLKEREKEIKNLECRVELLQKELSGENNKQEVSDRE